MTTCVLLLIMSSLFIIVQWVSFSGLVELEHMRIISQNYFYLDVIHNTMSQWGILIGGFGLLVGAIAYMDTDNQFKLHKNASNLGILYVGLMILTLI